MPASSSSSVVRRSILHATDFSGWRSERINVRFATAKESGLCFTIDRGAASVLGVCFASVTLSGPSSCRDRRLTSEAYTRDVDGAYKMWVATRAAGKRNWPGLLDSTVCGGLKADETAFEGICREAAEEASFSPALCRALMRPVGTIGSIGLTKDGMVSAGFDYVFDLQLPADAAPQMSDGEVERFDLYTVEELIEALFAGHFMPGVCVASRPR